MMRALILALSALLVFATPALAGCEAFGISPKESYREIEGRRGVFVMALGAFSEGPVVDEIFALALDGSETSTRIVAGHFEGRSASPEGFTLAFEVNLEIAQRCNMTGCHPRLDGTRYLVFLEKWRGRYNFAEDGCAYRAYENPEPAALNGVISCLNGVCQ